MLVVFVALTADSLLASVDDFISVRCHAAYYCSYIGNCLLRLHTDRHEDYLERSRRFSLLD